MDMNLKKEIQHINSVLDHRYVVFLQKEYKIQYVSKKVEDRFNLKSKSLYSLTEKQKNILFTQRHSFPELAVEMLYPVLVNKASLNNEFLVKKCNSTRITPVKYNGIDIYTLTGFNEIKIPNDVTTPSKDLINIIVV